VTLGFVVVVASGFFLFFQTAYFLHIGNSEGLFLAVALACILAARGERWWLAGVLGAFCWMTRATGAVLVTTLAVEAAQHLPLSCHVRNCCISRGACPARIAALAG
jgi:Gpi18-like mannosyltransferase